MYEALAAAEKVAKSTVTRPFSEQRPDREAERDSRGPAHDLTHAMQQFWRPTLLQLTLRFEGDRLPPGEEAKIAQLKAGSQVKIHGQHATAVANLLRVKRDDCPVIGTYRQGPDASNCVLIEEVPRPRGGAELWLDPALTIKYGTTLLDRAKADPSAANLTLVAERRAEIKAWLEGVGKTVAADPNARLTRGNLDDYRRFFRSAEDLWSGIDRLLALHKHSDAAKDTHDGWAKGTGSSSGDLHHAMGVTKGAKYHVDIFGEGYYPDAINIGVADRSTTTGVRGTRVPNLIYRRFGGVAAANRLPIADQAADLVTSENGPVGQAGLAEEIARIIAPGGTIVLYNPDNYEYAHDKVIKAVGQASVVKIYTDGTVQTTIVTPQRRP